MCDVYIQLRIASSSGRERDVARINEKQHSLADLGNVRIAPEVQKVAKNLHSVAAKALM